MDKVVIGIHGLANKPSKELLADWWKKAMLEGLRNVGVKDAQFEFEMVYWADALYKSQQHTDPLYGFDSLYLEEQYVEAEEGALKAYNDSWRDEVRATLFDLAGTTLDAVRSTFGENPISRWLLGRLLKDLAFYYDEKRMIKNSNGQPGVARRVLDSKLAEVMKANRDKQIMLVAHSMGSIIAYNVLRQLGRSEKDMQVERFVTIGSPLGMPYVKGRIIDECDYDATVRTPTIVSESWVNYSDKKDPVCIDIHLRDDYQKNKRGVRVEDDLVANDYRAPEGERNRNHHKSYGYLRTPEFSERLKAFLAS